MLKGPAVTAIVAVLAMAGVVAAFMKNASPYVTIAEGRKMGGDGLHVAGNLIKSSVHTDLQTSRLTFQLKDERGDVMTVEHAGVQPANLMEADKVVAIGGFHDGRFVSRDLLVKCPSKYEAKDQKPVALR